VWQRPRAATLTLDLDPVVAAALEESARREHKAVQRWAAERLALAAMEDATAANGYPAGWMKLFGAVDDADGFESPARGGVRPVEPMTSE
jgi:hypothetical protein